MEQIVETGISLFADTLPSMADIKKLMDIVNSSESRRIAFAEQLKTVIGETSSKAVLAAGIGLHILGRNTEAVEKLKKAKDCQEKYIYSAFALRQIRQFDDAIKSLTKSLEYDADKAFVRLEKAATYRHALKFEEAAKELKACANLENTSAEYHYQLARLAEAIGQYQNAVENYKKAIELVPGHQRALFHLAYRCDLSGDEGAAIDYYKHVIAGTPVYINALMNLAVIYEDAAKYDKAARCIENILKYHPNHQRAIMFLKDAESSKTMFYDEDKEKKKTYKNRLLETPISDFELSVRSRNCLKKMNIETIGDLLSTSEAQLLAYKNFGETSLREIKVILDSKGLRLGMALEEEQGVLDSGAQFSRTRD